MADRHDRRGEVGEGQSRAMQVDEVGAGLLRELGERVRCISNFGGTLGGPIKGPIS
jgi:hypothetical protein